MVDVVPPALSMSSATSEGVTTITLSAEDNASGVKDIFYSLDGSNFQVYSGPIQVNPFQTPVIYAFADDNQANRSRAFQFSPLEQIYLPLVIRPQ